MTDKIINKSNVNHRMTCKLIVKTVKQLFLQRECCVCFVKLFQKSSFRSLTCGFLQKEKMFWFQLLSREFGVFNTLKWDCQVAFIISACWFVIHIRQKIIQNLFNSLNKWLRSWDWKRINYFRKIFTLNTWLAMKGALKGLRQLTTESPLK